MGLAAGSIGKIDTHMMRHAAWQLFAALWGDHAPGVTVGQRRTKRCQKALRRSWKKRRTTAYAWLADQLGLLPVQCKFRYFDRATLDRVIALCRAATPEEVCGGRAKDRAA